jgi:hypothetical protein
LTALCIKQGLIGLSLTPVFPVTSTALRIISNWQTIKFSRLPRAVTYSHLLPIVREFSGGMELLNEWSEYHEALEV